MCVPWRQSHRDKLGAGWDTQPGISAGSLLSAGPQAAHYRFHCLDVSVSEPLSLLVFIGVCLTVNISLLMLLDINQLR